MNALAGRGRRLAAAALLAALSSLVAVSPPGGPSPAVAQSPAGASTLDPPTLAYYYIWFDPTSWNRAKSDLPLAGKYSSDERLVMEDHVRMAKAAGIDGFIVSWKWTSKLDRRLAQLADIAEAEDFSLVVMYQGLDFERQPLPLPRVAGDLDHFMATFADRPAFQLFDRPTVILSGSWMFSADDIASLGQGRRDHIALLASEKDTDGIDRLRGLVDGDAYYWSSVNPDTFPDYEGKLDEMSAAARADGGLWIAPASPGFDARLVGGTTVVERQDGDQLRRQYAAAVASSPDAVGIISWNEFSENSHIEPSRTFGSTYLDVAAELLGGTPADGGLGGSPLDSSEPGERGSGRDQAVALGFTGLAVSGAVTAVAVRRRRMVDTS